MKIRPLSPGLIINKSYTYFEGAVSWKYVSIKVIPISSLEQLKTLKLLFQRGTEN